MTCALLIAAFPLTVIAALRVGWWWRSITQLRMPASNSIEAADLPVVDHEEFPINSGA